MHTNGNVIGEPPALQAGAASRTEARHNRRSANPAAAAQARIEAAFKRRGVSVLWCLPAIAAIWLLAAGYFFLLPPVYHSEWSLILPAASNGSTVSLQNIGQTSTAPSQPFGTVTLSPKVIYKEIAGSEQVRQAAAKLMDMDLRSFGKARVKLIDETSLMIFKIGAGNPGEAQAKARALMQAFERQLEILRSDELEKRAKLVRENLKVYRANLENVRKKMRDFQNSSGLLSIEQFKEASSSAERLRQKLGVEQAGLQELQARQKRLMGRVGLSPELAAKSIRLASDPAFGQLAKVYAEASAKVHEADGRYGPRHPALLNARMKASGALAQLIKMARRFDSSSGTNIGELILVLNTSHQSDLFKAIVSNESALSGKIREVAAMEKELAELEAKVKQMGKAASQLEALQKDQLVAEAVFTSAAARLDISRTDIFASYPMVQVLAEPDLPVNRSQPRLRYAIAAGVLGTFFVLLAWGAAWVRSRFGRKR